jgi:hypothetical protein
VTVSDKGTGQGSVISPLLANIYLHYSLDLWAERWQRREATGDMIMVRYADDVVVGFERETDARRFWDAMRDRLQEFSLSLHPEKTRLIEFGRHAAIKRKQRGLGKPETFDFLGMTFICGKSRAGKFLLKRRTRCDRMQAKIKEVAGELRRRMHQLLLAGSVRRVRWSRTYCSAVWAQIDSVPLERRDFSRIRRSAGEQVALAKKTTRQQRVGPVSDRRVVWAAQVNIWIAYGYAGRGDRSRLRGSN